MTEQDVFSRKAEQWWDLEGPFKMLHKMNACRTHTIQKSIRDLKGKTVFDYGCGGGILAETLSSMGAKVTGMDMSRESIEVARAHGQKKSTGVNYLHGTIDDLDDRYFSDAQFDVVCALECLEHVTYPERLVASLSGCTKEGGYAVFSTINRSLYTYLMGIVAAEYLLGWVEPGTHEHAKFIKPSELVKMSKNSGLELEELEGMSFSMRDQDFSLSNDVSLNYIAIFKKQKKTIGK